MSQKLIQSAKQEISTALEDTYDVKGSSFERKLKRARRHLPHKVKRDAEYLVQAEAQLKHPKLRRFVDTKRVETARDRVLQQARTANPERDRSRAMYGWASGLVINLLLALALIFVAYSHFGGA